MNAIHLLILITILLILLMFDSNFFGIFSKFLILLFILFIPFILHIFLIFFLNFHVDIAICMLNNKESIDQGYENFIWNSLIPFHQRYFHAYYIKDILNYQFIYNENKIEIAPIYLKHTNKYKRRL